MLRFTVVVLLLIGAFEVLFATVLVPSAAFQAYLGWSGRLSAALLGMFGYDIRVDGVTMTGNAALVVSPGCDGWQTVAMYCAALLGYPASWSQRLWGALGGSSVILLVNVGRVSSLYLVILHHPQHFKLVHETVWPIALMLLTMALWIAWIRFITLHPSGR